MAGNNWASPWKNTKKNMHRYIISIYLEELKALNSLVHEAAVSKLS